MFLLILRSTFQVQVQLPLSVTQTATRSPKLGRITKTVFKGKSPEKGFVPKNITTITKFTAYCEESENYCIASSVDYISVHQVDQNVFFFKNLGININFGLYDFHQKYLTMFLGVAIKAEMYHCTYSFVNIALWTPSWPVYQKYSQKWSKHLQN